MKVLLLFAYECAPFHSPGSTIGAQRPAMFAKYLSDFGWRTIIICCDFKTRRIQKRKDIADIKKNVVSLLESSDPLQPLIISVPSLKYDGIIDRLWFSLTKYDERTGSFRDKNKLCSLLRKPLTILKQFKGDHSQSWQPVALAVAGSILSKTKVDILIGEHGPDAGIYVAQSISNKYNIPWIADFRDPILQPVKDSTRNLYKNFLQSHFKNCSATINVTPYWQDLDKQLFKLPSYCVTNGFDEDEFMGKDSDTDYGKFRIFYSGSIKSSVQDIDLFFKGLNAFIQSIEKNDQHLVEFFYRGLSSEIIKKKAIEYEVEDILDLQTFIPRNELIKVMKRSTLLLLLSADISKANIFYSKGFYPGKTFEYFGAQRPILLIPGDNGILDDLIRKSKTGKIKSTSQEIADYLSVSFKTWKNGNDIEEYAPALDVVRFYTRKNQTAELSKILNKHI